jgi:ABC-type dipeptide/oligopeptide/nickel transport system ATPase component
MSKSPELIDWYSQKSLKKYLTKNHNPYYDKHHIKLPFRMVIAGSSGSGKTSTLLNLIHNMPDTFERIHICTKNADEPLYNYLKDKLKDSDFKITEGIYTLPDLDQMDKTQNNLIVLDDLCNESAKSQKPICDYVIRCRKKNCSLIYISQSFYQVPKLIRDNINYLILKQVSSLRNLTCIMREASLGIDKKQLKNIYEDATKDKMSFLLIDLEGPKDQTFRCGLDQIYQVEQDFK